MARNMAWALSEEVTRPTGMTGMKIGREGQRCGEIDR